MEPMRWSSKIATAAIHFNELGRKVMIVMFSTEFITSEAEGRASSRFMTAFVNSKTTLGV